MAFDRKPRPPLSEADILRRFQCQGCGNCCRGDGYVFLDDGEVRRLALFLDLSIEEFKKQYTRTIESGSLVLRDQDDPDQSCIFLENDRCRVHEAKPLQCVGFPHKWRPPNIDSFCEGWREAAGLPPIGGRARQNHEAWAGRASAKGEKSKGE